MMPQNQPIAGKATNALQPLRPLQPGSFYRMKMKELLGKIQALSGNKYLHQDPEQIAYIQYGLNNTGGMIIFSTKKSKIIRKTRQKCTIDVVLQKLKT